MPQEEKERRIELRHERSGHDVRSLWVCSTSDGGLSIEGQDLGPEVERYWGSSEYEWVIVIAPEHVAGYVRRLGGDPERDDPLTVVERRYREDSGCVTKSFLDEEGIPCEFWSRVGD